MLLALHPSRYLCASESSLHESDLTTMRERVRGHLASPSSPDGRSRLARRLAYPALSAPSLASPLLRLSRLPPLPANALVGWAPWPPWPRPATKPSPSPTHGGGLAVRGSAARSASEHTAPPGGRPPGEALGETLCRGPIGVPRGPPATCPVGGCGGGSLGCRACGPTGGSAALAGAPGGHPTWFPSPAGCGGDGGRPDAGRAAMPVAGGGPSESGV